MASFLGVLFALVDRTVEHRLEWMDEFDRWDQQRAGRAAEAPLAIPGPGSYLVPEDRRKRELHLNLISTPTEVAMQLLRMNFPRCFAPTSAAFVTSDAPVTIVLQRGDRVSYANGLENPAVEVFFPISPKVCLL